MPRFLVLAKRMVQVEEAIVVKMLEDHTADVSAETWVDSVRFHYEWKRRADVLDSLQGACDRSEPAR